MAGPRSTLLTGVLLVLAATGCAGRRADEAVPGASAPPPDLRLSYTAERGHAPGNGVLRAVARDVDGELARVTLAGPSVSASRAVSGGVDSLAIEVNGLPDGIHVFVGTVESRGGRTGSDTLTVRVDPNDVPPGSLTAAGNGPWWHLVQEAVTDPQGDPVEYTLVVEGPVAFTIGPRGTPVDTTVTLPAGRYDATAVTGDGHATSSRTESFEVVIRPPTASQRVVREGVSLRYSADVDAEGARLVAVKAPGEVFYHGPVPRDTTFAGLAVGEGSGLPKGDYFFRIYGHRHGRDLDQTIRGHIVDLEPSVDLSGIDASFEAGKGIVVTLPAPRDPNPEDHPTYVRAASLDGKVSAELNGSELGLQAVADSTGPFRIELEIGDTSTGVRADTLAATIRPRPAEVDTAGFKSGYGAIVAESGETSVDSDLRADDREKDAIFDVDVLSRHLDGYYRLKRRLKDDYRVAFGVDYSFLNQYSSFSTTDTQAASGILRLFGTWQVAGREESDWAGIVYRVENRHLMGRGITPRELGLDGGSSVTTASFSDFDWGLTALYWRHRFRGSRLSLAVGKMSAGSFADTYALNSAYTFFLTESFADNPSVALPGQGLALVALFKPVGRWYARAGVHDANGSLQKPGFETFFRTREYFTWVEAGWSPGNEPLAGQSIHVNVWHKDPRETTGTEEAWGAAVSASHVFDDRWVPFLRAGNSDGDGGQRVRATVAGGMGVLLRTSDFIGLATSWSAPIDRSLRDQVTSELIYRAQLTPHMTVSPAIQLTVNPSRTAETDFLGVASTLRVRIAL